MESNKALFLDRDGIINVDYGYVGTLEKFKLIEGIIELCSEAISAGYKIYIITNQAGIAKNKFTLNQFLELTKYIINLFSERGIDINVYFCPYHSEAIDQNYILNHKIQHDYFNCLSDYNISNNIFLSDYRKPSPGMILQAQKRFNLNLKESIFIGDQKTDMLAANLAGLSKAVLVNKEAINITDDYRFVKKLPTFNELLKLINFKL
ncbi:D-glycero-alpha-D-manno-heptose-1,7-bisphosphate 7-phosphatase [Candidatus Hepatincolaceae symbiont of Richtersius coronifer]